MPLWVHASVRYLNLTWWPSPSWQGSKNRGVTALDDYRLSIFGTHMYLLYLPNRRQTRAVRTCIDFLLAKANPGSDSSPGVLPPT